MLSYQAKYQINAFIKRNYILARLIVAVIVISLVFWVIALFNYYTDDSTGSYFENLMALLAYLIAPVTLSIFLRQLLDFNYFIFYLYLFISIIYRFHSVVNFRRVVSPVLLE